MAKKAITPEALKDAETRGWDDWWCGTNQPPKTMKGELAEAWKAGQDKAFESRNVPAVLYKEFTTRGYYLGIAELELLTIEQRNILGEALRDETFDSLDWLDIDTEEKPIPSDPDQTAFHCRVVEASNKEPDNHGFEAPSPLVAGTDNSGDDREEEDFDDEEDDDDDDDEVEDEPAPVAQKTRPPVSLTEPLELHVDFGGVSFNAETVSVGLTMQRDAIRVGRAAEVFAGTRIEGDLYIGNGQRQLPGMDDAAPHISGSFDSSSLSVKRKLLGARLRFPYTDTTIEQMAKFAKRSGRLIVKNFSILTDDDRDDDERDADIVHEDVEAGKHRPHGHPAMEALAQVQRETLPFPAPAAQKPREDEKLELCDDQLLASLKSVAVPVIPAEVLREWSPELRDEIDTWAKQVLQAMSGVLDVELPDIPDELLFYLADEQKNDPVQFALQQVGHEVTALGYYCFECQKHRPMEPEDDGHCRTDGCSYGAVCTLCGFYGDPNVDSAGIYVESNEFYIPTPSIVCADGSGLTIRVAQGVDGKHRPSSILHADLEGVDHLFPEAAEAPSIRHPGFATEKQAVVGEAERLSGLLQAIDGEEAKQLLKDLQSFTLRVKIQGESPREISDATISDDDVIAGKVGE